MYLYNGEYGVATDENGLYYMRARYYNSEIKRFVNQDVLTGTISDSPTMNRYAYVNGNPISLADPFGLSPSLNWLGHAALDVLGLIPGFGAIFDLINAGWYFIEGDYFSAFCSFVSALPGVGDAIGLMGKGAKLACGVQKGLHIAANMGSLFKSTYVIGNVVRTNIDRYLINGEEFSWSQLGVDLLTIGLEVFAMKNAAKGLVEAENMQVCFVAGTLITTAEGYKAIEEIQVGDVVLAEDAETGEVAYKTVLETYENETTELVHVHVNGETISATPTHPFYINQFGWTRAADLRAGDVLVLSNGEYVVVEFIQHEILEEPVKVYNFEVEDYHTYFVGEVSVLVHNGCGDDVPQTWNEFQAANKGIYTNQEMAAAWIAHKQEFGIYSNGVSSGASSRILRDNLKKVTQEPTYANAAHHIVAGDAKRAKEAREILDAYGIKINDAVNGVFLPTQSGVSNAALHTTLHTHDYYKKVNNLLSQAKSKQEVEGILKQISSMLQNGTF